MTKLISLVLASSLSFVSAASALAAKTSSSDTFLDKVKNGVMWAPKKIGHGIKAIGEKTKKALHGGK